MCLAVLVELKCHTTSRSGRSRIAALRLNTSVSQREHGFANVCRRSRRLLALERSMLVSGPILRSAHSNHG
jgi:hypothetical protein